MPVPDQGPAAQVGHACCRRATSVVPARANPWATAHWTVRSGERCCQRRLPPSRGHREIPRGANRAPSSILASKVGAGGRTIGLSLGTFCGASEWAGRDVHSRICDILVAEIISVPVLTGAMLVMVAVFGCTRFSDRVFRLLRCFSHREEPPAPIPLTYGTALSGGRGITGRSVRAWARFKHGRAGAVEGTGVGRRCGGSLWLGGRRCGRRDQ